MRETKTAVVRLRSSTARSWPKHELTRTWVRTVVCVLPAAVAVGYLSPLSPHHVASCNSHVASGFSLAALVMTMIVTMVRKLVQTVEVPEALVDQVEIAE